jgi:hypothetical protein
MHTAERVNDVHFRRAGGMWADVTWGPKASHRSLFDVASGRELLTSWYPEKEFAPSPDGRMLAVWNPEKPEFEFMETASATSLGRFPAAHRGKVRALAFSADGRWFASGGGDTSVLIWEWTKATGLRLHADARLDAETREFLWADLAAEDGIRAQRALQSLAADRDAVAFLKEKARPATADDHKDVRELLGRIDDRVIRELAVQGRAIEPLLREALDGKRAVEDRQRIQELLESPELARWSPESLRAIRVVQLLEQINTKEARQLLDELARGEASALLTQEATAAQKRRPVP